MGKRGAGPPPAANAKKTPRKASGKQEPWQEPCAELAPHVQMFRDWLFLGCMLWCALQVM